MKLVVMMLLAAVINQDIDHVNAIQLNPNTIQLSQLTLNDVHRLLQQKSKVSRENAEEMLQKIKALVNKSDLS